MQQTSYLKFRGIYSHIRVYQIISNSYVLLCLSSNPIFITVLAVMRILLNISKTIVIKVTAENLIDSSKVYLEFSTMHCSVFKRTCGNKIWNIEMRRRKSGVAPVVSFSLTKT